MVNQSLQTMFMTGWVCLSGSVHVVSCGDDVGRIGCLDYIWHTKHFDVETFWDLPPKQLVHPGLPNAAFPSDHLPIMADLTLY